MLNRHFGAVPEVIPLRYDRSPTSCEASVSFYFLIPKWNTTIYQQCVALRSCCLHRRRMLSAQILPGLFQTIGPISHGRPFCGLQGGFSVEMRNLPAGVFGLQHGPARQEGGLIIPVRPDVVRNLRDRRSNKMGSCGFMAPKLIIRCARLLPMLYFFRKTKGML